jgi:hypothetical protein
VIVSISVRGGFASKEVVHEGNNMLPHSTKSVNGPPTASDENR